MNAEFYNEPTPLALGEHIRCITDSCLSQDFIFTGRLHASQITLCFLHLFVCGFVHSHLSHGNKYTWQ